VKSYINIFFLLCLICLVTTVRSQPVANFSVNVSSGCSPFIVHFTDESTPEGTITSWEWIFGNGNTSFLKNPQASYVNPGTYTVTLIVSDGSEYDTLTVEDIITVFDDPEPDFTYTTDILGCMPLTVFFHDLSVEADGPIVEWHWDFGDGNTSDEQDPEHIYYYSGDFPVSLQVIDDNGCDAVKMVPDYISVTESPDPQFTADQSSYCMVPFEVNFTNNTTGPGNITYLWDFGDGNTSEEINPSHTYTLLGTFDVSLTAYSDNGCSTTITDTGYIEIVEVVAQFAVNEDTICPDEAVLFMNTSTGGDTYQWDFGDGYGGSGFNAAHAYSSPGEYIVSLHVSLSGVDCFSDYSDTIVVEQVIAGFSIDTGYSCEVPFTVQYSDQSVNAHSWEWHFGNNNSSGLQDPENIFGLPGYYTDTLIVISSHGCKDTMIIEDNVIVILPNSFYTSDVYQGCAPLDVNISDLCTYESPYDSIASWHYDFDDGNTSDEQNPSHTFTGEGEYDVVLTITTELGCSVPFSQQFSAGTKPVADFSSDKDTSCAYDPVQFTDLSEDTEDVNSWYWEFSDGGYSQIQNPDYQFTDTGYMEVSLIAGYNGCYDTVIVPDFVYINGPLCSFNAFIEECENPLDFTFIDTVTEANRWYWDFNNDGTYDDSLINTGITSSTDTFYYSYPASGSYFVRLSAFNDSTGCLYINTTEVYVSNLQAAFVQDDSVGCPGMTVMFISSLSQDNSLFMHEGNFYRYKWDFGDGDIVYTGSDTTYHTFNQTGIFNVYLTVQDAMGCRDSMMKKTRIYQPIVDFEADTLSGCLPVTVEFTNNTVSDTTVSSWEWVFGDGETSGDQDPTHFYGVAGNYTVSLVATDVVGCSDSLGFTDYIKVLASVPEFYVQDSTLCLGDTAYYVNTTMGDSLNFLWDFGDTETSNDFEPFHVYTDTGYFSVSLQVIDSMGCDSLCLKSNLIHVQDYPVPDFITDTASANCYPLPVQFTNQTTGNYIDSWHWDFGDGAISTLPDPLHIYSFPGDFNITLTATTTNGCTDSIVKDQFISVSGPYADFSILEDTICRGDVVTFVVDTTKDVFEFNWDFGDGVVDSVSGDTAYHVYDYMGALYPSLIYTDSLDMCPQYELDSIHINVIIAGFSVLEDTLCTERDVTFTNNSFSAVEWLWDFGDSNMSAEEDPVHAYTNPGTYFVSLIVTDAEGCKDTAGVTIQVNQTPLSQDIHDTIICQGDIIVFDAGAGYDGYLWSDGSTDQTLAVSGGDSVYYQVMNSDGCWSFPDSINITEVTVPVFDLGNDTIICEGDTLPLDAGTGYDSYLWHNDSTYQVFYADTVGLYHVTVTNICGSTYDTIAVDMVFLPVTDLGQDTAICEGDSITLDAGTGYDYLWHNSSTEQTFTSDTAGIFFVTVSNACAAVYDTVALEIIPLPFADLGSDTSICEDDSITINAAGSTWDNYLWHDGSTEESYTADTAEICYVEVYNICDTVSDTITVDIILFPVVDLGEDTSICYGDSITFDADGNSYDSCLWQDGTTDQAYTTDTAGIYYVNMVNQCGTTGDTVSLGIIHPPFVDIGPDTSVCDGDSITFIAVCDNAENYLWHDASTDTIFATIEAGLYHVTVSNECFSDADTVDLTVIPLPVADLGNDTVLCDGDTIILDAGAGMNGYLWSDGSTDQHLTVITTDTISVQTENNEGCWSIPDTVIVEFVPPPAVDLGSDTTICEGDTIVLDAGDNYVDEYLWSDGSTEQTFTTGDTGSYSVTVTNVCTSQADTIYIDMILLPVTGLGEDTMICEGDTLMLDAGGGYDSYLWQDGAEGQYYAAVNEGEYYVSVTNICGNTSDTLHLGIIPTTLWLGNDTAFCEGDSITLTAETGFDSYVWMDSIPGQSITIGDPGLYYVEATNICGMVDDFIMISVTPLPVVDLGADTSISTGSMIFDAGNPGAYYEWSTGAATQTISVSAGEYILWVEVEKDGCISSDTVAVSQYPDDGGCMIAVPTAFSPNGDGYNDVLYPRGYCVDNMELMIFNRLGEMVFKSTSMSQGWDGKYEGEYQDTQVFVYILTATLGDGTAVERKGNITLIK